ncbi:hypothetical protein BBBR_0566 [Bifidobacterium breve DSM 20213 = JCM 1192]|nr:hypothetical protein BBBR_0566 [Bifidobacterium breve DSM 20213 = JCM 1192]
MRGVVRHTLSTRIVCTNSTQLREIDSFSREPRATWRTSPHMDCGSLDSPPALVRRNVSDNRTVRHRNLSTIHAQQAWQSIRYR